MTTLTGRRLIVWLVLALVVLAAAVLAAVAIGMPEVDLATALADPGSWQHRALINFQLPRIVQGVLVGAVLAMSGAALQGLLRNPLADPFILGVSGGAALGSAVIGLVGAGFALSAPIGGFAGAVVALLIVTALATDRDRRVSPLKVLLVGVVFNALAGAILMVLETIADPTAVQATLIRLMGSLGVDPSRPELLWVLLASFLVGAVATLACSRQLNLLALGDETARSLGVQPDRLRLVLFVALSLPIGAVVAVTGLIGFVGLVVPHAIRLVAGPDHRLLLPLSALVGAAFVVLADALVSRLADPFVTELPVGVLTAIVGGPVFLMLLRVRPARVRA